MLGFKRQQIEEDIEPGGPMPLVEIEGALRESLESGENGVIHAVDLAIEQAVYHGASDIHLEPWRQSLNIRYRLDGALHDIATLDKTHHQRIVARIKVLAKLVAYQKETPQEGRIELDTGDEGRALRVSTFPTVHGEKVVIRVLDPNRELLDVDALGFSDTVVRGLMELAHRPNGTLLLTGPSSSGKTTTIYALLRELLSSTDPVRHIVTIEDPVEYRLDKMAQTQVNPNQGFTFEVAFRSLLRQDPDVVMVGEIRDSDTATTAVQAGLTGHLVISTIHSGTAAGVFSRLLDMGVEPFLIGSAVTGVLAQRLIRANCTACAEEYAPSEILLARYGLSGRKMEFKRGVGCEACRGIGFRGRTAIGEFLPVDSEISDLVLTRPPTSRIQKMAVGAGMTTLLQDALNRVAAGVTPLEELGQVLSPPSPSDAGEVSDA